jgi:hypothetical protein
MMDIVERLIVYRDRPGRSSSGRELLAEACNEIDALRKCVLHWQTLGNQGIHTEIALRREIEQLKARNAFKAD